MVIATTQKAKETIHSLVACGACDAREHSVSQYHAIQYPYNRQKPILRERIISEMSDPSTELRKLRRRYCSYYDKVDVLSRLIRSIKKR